MWITKYSPLLGIVILNLYGIIHFMNKFFSSPKIYMYCGLTALCFLMLGLWWQIIGVGMFALAEFIDHRTTRPPSLKRTATQLGIFLKRDAERSLWAARGCWLAGIAVIAMAVYYR